MKWCCNPMPFWKASYLLPYMLTFQGYLRISYPPRHTDEPLNCEHFMSWSGIAVSMCCIWCEWCLLKKGDSGLHFLLLQFSCSY